MAHRGVLSPRRQHAGAVQVTICDSEPPSTPPDVQRSVAAHRTRPRSPSSYFVAVAEGSMSAAAFHSVLAVATPIISVHDIDSPVQAAIRSGACLALGTPAFMLAARLFFVLAGLRNSTTQQPSLRCALPSGFDEHALLDLYVTGLGAGVLGFCVPVLESVGAYLGAMLAGSSGVSVVLMFLMLAPVVYVMVGACLRAAAPLEGFVTHSWPRRWMLALCATGHAVLLLSCFYSPDVQPAAGFILGFVHIVRLLQQVFSYPGTLDDGGTDVDE